MIDYQMIGKRIAQRRRELGLKQRDVAEMAELSDQYVSNIERAYSIPSIEVILRLCDVLQTTPDSILLGTRKETSDLRSTIEKRIADIPQSRLHLLSGIVNLLINDRNE